MTPPFSRMLVSLPFLFLKVQCPLNHPSWFEGNSPEFARQFFYHNTRTLDELIFWARAPMAVFSIFFGILVFFFSKAFFGNAAGLASLFLYSFCPDIIAFSGLATSDLVIALFYFLSVIRFSGYLKDPSWKNLSLTAISTGLAFLSKFTALLLFPTMLLIAIFLKKKKEISPKRVLVFLGLTLFTVWAGYFFEMKPLLQNTPDPPKKIAFLEKIGGEPLVRFAEKQPIPLATFASSLGGLFFTRAAGTHAYLMGEWSDTGWWYYYLVAFLIKNTLPMVLLSILSLLLVKKAVPDRWTRCVLVVPVGLFFIATLPDRAQAGIRYFLPIYPFLFLLMGGLVALMYRHSKPLKILALALLFWHGTESLASFPDHLSYFSQGVGGSRNGYRYLRDSNIDWGQDLKGLSLYAKKQGLGEVALYFLGPVDPAYYGMATRPLTPEEFKEPGNTVYAIGAHAMDNVLWTKRAKPVQVIGHSIFVYDFRNPAL
ncbi:MAG: glycosyltransferase family 39 protein [Candidatus Omnitrophica bacterium]|nr:glycosyltransferase family 39 protein [Candidatus Omnitrophota bacterium]